MRQSNLFNGDWLYSAGKLSLEAGDDQFEPVTLPHTNKTFPHHNFDNREYQFVSTYRKRFKLPAINKDQLVFLEFDGVMIACSIHLNGNLISEHLGGFSPFSVNITDVLNDGDNELTVYVDSNERNDVPPFGHLVDYLTFGGIYRDVHLTIVNAYHIEDLFVTTKNVLDDPRLSCAVTLNQELPQAELRAVVCDQFGEEVANSKHLVDHETTTLDFKELARIRLWSLDDPVLYTIHVSLFHNGEEIDLLSSRFGFREARFHPDGGFYLNGQRIQLFGLNRHQTYPTIGAAAPARLQRQDADILKFELSCNIVRTSHYPQSVHFLNRCDEIGLLVFEEMTGWQHIGDQAWQDLYLDELNTIIRRDRNHPSVVLWGVRVNESGDNDALYKHTNALAHELDPTRQTGGVRCFRESSFLEDVFTYNDFSNDVLEPVQQPYLISEFAGHMFPTKTWDHEQRLIDHALLHARIQNKQLGNPKIAGAIGWCAFDYATHIEFGSGDRICYHGVMDIFRLPKWAAYFYKSQQSPTRQIVLQPATHWTMGDRSGGGNNPLTVFSNCDEIEVMIGEIHVGKFTPDRENYPNLPHPPFIVNGLDKYTAWGQRQFYNLHLIGYIDGKPVAEHRISSNQVPRKLVLTTDTDQLIADGADMTRLIFQVTDEFGNVQPYANKVVTFELEGQAELVGENPFPLIGGQAALFVKAGHQPSEVIIRAHALGLDSASTSINILPVSNN